MRSIHRFMLEVNKVLKRLPLLEHVMFVEQETICGGLAH